tara:strand:+ start:143 stop:2017 length:1875 start_codon:yes stop_codon:yes gene_type:complete
VCFLSLFTEVSKSNNYFFLAILLFSLFLNQLEFKYKKFLNSIIALTVIYVQFILNDYTLSKEYFINLIFILLLLKYAELESKENHYFFNFTCIFFSLCTLIFGQDLISSLMAFTVVIISIIQLYSLNQTKLISINLKNLFKYLSISFLIIPIVAIIYFVFPRTEVNIKLFETKQNTLGIPDKISLGSFQNITNSDENVFIYTPNDILKDEKFYFRVKVYDILNRNNDWVGLDYDSQLTKFSKDIKIRNNKFIKKSNSKLLIFANEKKWLPKLKEYSFKSNKLKNNLFNNTTSATFDITSKQAYEVYKDKKDYLYSKNLIKYYTSIPKNKFYNLNEWSEEIYKNSDNDLDYLNKILLEFSNNNFFYSLSPQNIGNNYEEFFFKTKTGYCEYYAGTFAILARLAGIPARIVSGYYGGTYNEMGNFYTFKQQDAHSWVEVLINNEWLRYDPTLSIPTKNILDTNNENIFNQINTTELNLNIKGNNDLNIKIYFDYFNYIWTNSFVQYDNKSRDKFIKDNLFSQKTFKNGSKIFLTLIIILTLIKFLNIIFRKKIFFNYFFNNLIKRNKILNFYMTHQEIFNNLTNKQKLQFKEIFDKYEKIKFSDEYKISNKDFLNLNKIIIKNIIF